MKMKKKPLISIVTVVYNNVNEIEQTILSVLNQTYLNIEYIIIDGGSIDGTIDCIKKYSSQISYWISESDEGVYDAMNKGISKASGEWINFMNSGDCFFSESTITDFFNYVNDGMDVIFGDTVIKRRKHQQVRNGELKENDFPGLCHQSVFVRTDLMLRYKFELKYKIAADFNFLYKLFTAGYKFQYIPIIVSVYDVSHGLSADNRVRLYLECCVIKGEKMNRRKLFVYRMKDFLSKILPRMVLDLKK